MEDNFAENLFLACPHCKMDVQIGRLVDHLVTFHQVTTVESSRQIYIEAEKKFVLGKFIEAQLWCLALRRSKESETIFREKAGRLFTDATKALTDVSYLPNYEEAHSKLSIEDIRMLFFPTHGEKWLTQDDVNIIEANLKDHLDEFRSAEAAKLKEKCLLDLKLRRKYQIPKLGYAEIIATEKIEKLIDLRLLRFIREGVYSPQQVFVRIIFFEQPKVLIIKINHEGRIELPEIIKFSEKLMAILEILSLFYFKELVVPQEVKSSEIQIIQGSQISGPGQYQEQQHSSRTIPRKYYSRSGDKDAVEEIYSINEWHYSQFRALHDVIGHARLIGSGFIADEFKQEQARSAGVNLQIGYTWVVEHSRGGDIPHLVKPGGDLSRRTIFTPSQKTQSQIDSLIKVKKI